ncbi:MAG: TetR/AcrR family transcriptional regulator [Halanaerobiales bacterium]
MPKFTEEERNYYYEKLIEEGERLFNLRGLKGVTVDEITANIGLGKGTFYNYFQNKEHLYMAINNSVQKEIFNEVEKTISNFTDIKNSEGLYQIMNIVLEFFKEHPMITYIDNEVYQRLLKKVPAKCMEENNNNDKWIVNMLVIKGFKFKYSEEIVIKLLQLVFLNAATCLKEGDGEKVLDLMFRAISKEVVFD